jgi:tetratricopeptide (TPR) repeat protein
MIRRIVTMGPQAARYPGGLASRALDPGLALRALVLALALAAALAGCTRTDRHDDARGDCTCAGEPVVDAALLGFLSKARAAHHEADLAESANDRPRAINALEALVKGPRPRPVGSNVAPEVAEVLADTFARLADLRSQAGDFDAALRDVTSGLELATKPTHFRGHLFEIQGVVHERRAKAFEAAHETERAAQAKALALGAFETAIKIQDQVIDEALSGKGARDGG